MQKKLCPLSKRIPREMKKNFFKYLGMVLILVCVICIGSSFQVTLDAAKACLDDIVDDNLQEDGFFEIGAEKLPDSFQDFCESEDITVCENFYLTDNAFSGDCKVLVFDERENLDIPVLFEGKMPEGRNEVVLDHVFAKGKGLKVGDKINLLDREFTLCGTVSMPDYSSLFMNNTDLVMNTSRFCVGVTDHETFEEFGLQEKTFRYSYRFEQRDLSKKEKNDAATAMVKQLVLSGNKVNTFLTADENQSIAFLPMDIGTDGPFMKVFVYLLVALIAFVFAVLINNTIEQESVIIGTMMALGYRKGEIIRHYLTPTVIVALVGSGVGNLLGYTVMIRPFVNIYYNTYSIGPLNMKFSLPAFATTTILPVTIMVLINLWMLWRKLSLTPLKFLRRDLKKKGQKKARRLPAWSFRKRFRLRVILQNKGNYILLFFGVFLASFLLMFGIGLKPLMNHYTDSIDSSLPYEYQYILKAPVEIEGGEKVTVYEMETWFALGGKDINITLMGIDEDSRFFSGANVADTTQEKVCISSALSAKMNRKPGDSFTLKDSVRENEYEFTVDSVYDYSAGMTVFMSRENLNRLLGEEPDSFNSLLSDRELSPDSGSVAKQISRADLLGAADQMMDSFGTVILFINIFSVVVYLILMYILTKVVIEKNAISISYMKVFGYESREISQIYLSVTAIVVISSLIVCIPLEVLMFKGVLIFLSSMIEGYMEFYLPWYIYAAIVAIGIGAYYLINTLHMKSIRRVSLSEALKNRE